MAGPRVIAAMALLLVGFASAQNECTRDALNSGTSLFGHSENCELMVTCLNDLKRIVQPCPIGLLFDMEAKVCVWPQDVTCRNWDCSRQSTFPSVCDDQYWRCINDGEGFELVRCESGEVYDNYTSCTYDYQFARSDKHEQYCKRPAATGVVTSYPPSTNFACEDRPDLESTYMKRASNGDPCMFDNFLPSNPYVSTHENRPCAPGTGFDEVTCRCIKRDECSVTVLLPQPGQCPATTMLDFSDGFSVVGYEGNQRMVLNDSVARRGVIARSGVATFSEGRDQEPAFLYMPKFNNKEIRSPTVFAITFSLGNQQYQQTFDLIRNERDNQCQGLASLRVHGDYDGYTLTVTVDAMGETDNGVENSGQMFASLNVNSNSFIKLTLIMEENQMHGTLVPESGSPVDLSPVLAIGAKLKRTHCGFEFGHGLIGDISEIAIYEGCQNPSLVDTYP